MSAVAILSCQPNSHPFQERHISLHEPVKIGRSVARARPASNNGIFDCKVLSRNHAMLWYENGTVSKFCLFTCTCHVLYFHKSLWFLNSFNLVYMCTTLLLLSHFDLLLCLEQVSMIYKKKSFRIHYWNEVDRWWRRGQHDCNMNPGDLIWCNECYNYTPIERALLSPTCGCAALRTFTCT